MEALIMMLYNTTEKTYHPIFYIEKPFPSGHDDFKRFKSRGHHTKGFLDKASALSSLGEVREGLKKMGVLVIREELDNIFEWDGIEIPVDIQLRKKLTHEEFKKFFIVDKTITDFSDEWLEKNISN